MSERRRLNSSKLSLQSKSWSPSSTSASRHSCLHQGRIMKYYYTVSSNVHTRINPPELVAALPGDLLPLVRVEVGQQLLAVRMVISGKQSNLVHIQVLLSTHEVVIFIKFHKDPTKIVNFLLMANF